MKRAAMAAIFAFCAIAADAAIRIDFGKIDSTEDWIYTGKIPLIKKTEFFMEYDSDCCGNVLVIKSANSSGRIATLPKVNLKRYPVMRWRWRAKQSLYLSSGNYDDQIAAIYIGDDAGLTKTSIGYLWGNVEDLGTTCRRKYMGGSVVTTGFIMDNNDTKEGEWVVRERNVWNDFQKIYGREINNRYALVISGNTQNSHRSGRAEIDYIEFLTEEEARSLNEPRETVVIRHASDNPDKNKESETLLDMVKKGNGWLEKISKF
ncbi:MAG: DUF3047 domain-containing protein [Victivallaceae bacterium]|nr:DUF3047 domain-containing protein [Victivallaceae bacterium]